MSATATGVSQVPFLPLSQLSDGKLCDTRFSKCCGGAFEEFEHCWEHVHHNYLERGRDLMPEQPLPDLRDEDVARDWIMGRPDALAVVIGTYVEILVIVMVIPLNNLVVASISFAAST